MTTEKKKNSNRLLHVYGQDTQYEEVKIVGTRQSLEALQKAINKLISSNNATAKEKISDFVCDDGKEFELSIFMKPESEFQEENLPYTVTDIWDGESV